MAGAVLSAHEREEIRVGLEAAESFTDIARRLDRAPSTVSQEVGRNGGRLSYCAADASVRAAKNRCRPRLTKFQRNRPMTDHVEARLVALDSPTCGCRECHPSTLTRTFLEWPSKTKLGHGPIVSLPRLHQDSPVGAPEPARRGRVGDRGSHAPSRGGCASSPGG